MGTSAAYWVAVGADHIIASPVSDVGSIGVTMSYLELASSTDNRGSRWIDISSGEYKDAGNPERVLSPKEREYFQGQVDAVHEYMVDRISSAREELSREEVANLADGRAYIGIEALKLKLVDELGSFTEAANYLKSKLSSGDDLVLCSRSGAGLDSLF
jgi:protease-4